MAMSAEAVITGIIFFIVQLGAIVWWGARLSAKVEFLTLRIGENFAAAISDRSELRQEIEKIGAENQRLWTELRRIDGCIARHGKCDGK